MEFQAIASAELVSGQTNSCTVPTHSGFRALAINNPDIHLFVSIIKTKTPNRAEQSKAMTHRGIIGRQKTMRNNEK
jgi:hypothetical protein